MSQGFIVGMGAESLNFDIVGSESQPAARENRIWVETSDAVTSWVFSPAQPPTPASGMLWFRLESSSAVGFNALRRNGIYLCPGSCSQYVSGSWVRREAKTCVSGQWVEWMRYLISGGEMRETWTFSGAISNPGAGCIELCPSQGIGGSGTVSISLDVTAYTTLTLDAERTGSSSCIDARVSVGGVSLDYKNHGGRSERTIDLSSMTGTQTITFNLANSNDEIGIVSWAEISVYDLYLS